MLYDSVDINNTYRAWVSRHMSLFSALRAGKKKDQGFKLILSYKLVHSHPGQLRIMAKERKEGKKDSGGNGTCL